MNRITNQDLDHLVQQINVMTDNPTEPYTDRKANTGHYHISGAYGGVQLVQIVSEHGSVREISRQGHGTKRELYTFLRGMVEGLSK